jgi:hypothetical protein
MAVCGQLFQEPGSPYVSRSGVMKDVDLPEAQPDLTVDVGEHYDGRLRLVTMRGKRTRFES